MSSFTIIHMLSQRNYYNTNALSSTSKHSCLSKAASDTPPVPNFSSRLVPTSNNVVLKHKPSRSASIPQGSYAQNRHLSSDIEKLWDL